MKLWKKSSIILRLFLILAIMLPLIIIVEQTSTLSANSETETTLDLGNFQPGTPVDHTHIWETKYDQFYHWQQCNICQTTTGKTAHKLEGNGGSKTLCANTYYNYAYREVCTCGYQSKPQVVLHGRYENYAVSQRLNYRGMEVKLSDVKQITHQEFKSISYPATPGGQPYTWSDPDGDGYGWVFMGGPVFGDSYGTKGTIQTILGSEGDCGRHLVFDEAFILARYISGDTTPTLAEFINYLPAKNTIPSNHLLYGYREKYQKATNAQFQQLVTEFKGYSTHTSGWGYTAMTILHTGHSYPGAELYHNYDCYDSSNKHVVSFTDGIKTHCDLCGANYTGNEEYEANTWYRCYTGAGLAEGQTARCGGHSLLGKGKVKLGTVYDTFTKKNGNVTRTAVTVNAEPGFTVTNSTAPWVLTKADTQTKVSYGYSGVVTFSNNKSGSALIQRSITCGAYLPLTDDTAPTAYGYSNNVTSNGYWKVNGNGTASNPSSQASVMVTFKDPQQYSKNQIKVRVYDSDQKTILPQGNGETYVPLTKVAGTSGANTLWQGNVNILTEVKGSKNIYIQAVDSVGYGSSLIPMQISYLDSKSPVVTTSVNIDNNTWARTKALTVKATDAFDIVNIGLDKKDIITIPKINNEFKRIYNMVGDVYDNKTIKVYVTDKVGNISIKDVTLNKIDNTKPTITNVQQNISENKKTTTITITANDINEKLQKVGSGINGYQITTEDTQPTEFQNSNIFQVDKNGTYYIWVRDVAGNISKVEEKVVNLEIDIISTVTWNDENNKYNARGGIVKLYRKTEETEEQYVAEQQIETKTNYTFQTRECDDNGTPYIFRIEQTQIDGYETIINNYDITNNLILPKYESKIEINPKDSFQNQFLKNGKVAIQATLQANSENREQVGIHNGEVTLKIDNKLQIDLETVNIQLKENIMSYTIEENIMTIKLPETQASDKLTIYLEGTLKEIGDYEYQLNYVGNLKDYRGKNTAIYIGDVSQANGQLQVTNQLPEAHIQFTKKDSITRENLSNATFTLYEWDGAQYVEVEEITDTDQDGVYTSKDYRWNITTQGRYKIVETKTPQYHKELGFEMDYVLDQVTTQNYTVSVDYDNEDYAIQYKVRQPEGFKQENGIIENEPWKTKIYINKIDSETKNRIRHKAEFTVYEWNKETNTFDNANVTMEQQENYTYLSSNWIYVTEKNEGKFRIIETTSPEGYYGDFGAEMQKEHYDIDMIEWIQSEEGQNEGTIEIGNIEADRFENIRTLADLLVQLKDSKTGGAPQGDATLEEAIYGIYAAQDIYYADGVKTRYGEPGLIYKKNELVQTQNSNSEGKIQWQNLEPGKYYVKMIQNPKGYQKQETRYDIDLSYENENIAKIQKNIDIKLEVKKEPFELYKTGENGEKLKNAGFSIYQISNLSIVKEGKITRKTLDTYELKDEQAKIELKSKENEDGSYQLSDIIEYYYKIKKAEGDSVQIEGDEEVYHPYQIQEETAREYTEEGYYNNIAEIRTDAEGHMQSSRLAYGEYIIIETSVPRKQDNVTPFIVQVTEDSEEPQHLGFVIDKNFRTKLKIYVKDANTTQNIINNHSEYVIKNAKTNELQTYQEGNITYGTRETPFVVGNDGYIETPMKLEIGEYILEQITAPNGYVKTGEEGFSKDGQIQKRPREQLKINVRSDITYHIDQNTGDYIIVAIQNNEPVVGNIKLSTNGEFLSNVEEKEEEAEISYSKRSVMGSVYELIVKENIITQDGHENILYEKGAIMGEFLTAKEAILENLPQGKYEIRQKQQTLGFATKDTTEEVTIKSNTQEEPVVESAVTIEEQRQKVKIKVYHKDSKTKQQIPGGLYELYTRENIIYQDDEGQVKTLKADTLITKVEADEEGCIEISEQKNKDIPLGKYYLKEAEIPRGYTATLEEIELDATTLTGEAEVLVEKEFEGNLTNIQIKNVDELGNSLIGAKIEILEEDNIIYTIDKLEKVNEIEGLPVEKQLTIKKTPISGYATGEDIHFSITKEGKIIISEKYTEMIGSNVILIKSLPTKLKVNIQDEETKEHIDGVEIEIHNENGKVEANIEQGEEKGTYIIKKLPFGHYKIIETKIPYENGYVVKQEKEVEIKDMEDWHEMVIEQGITKTLVKVVDKENKKALEGIEIEIHNENGKVNANIEQGEEKGTFIIKRLPVGHYKIVETKIPYENGYIGKQEVEIEVKDTNQWQETVIEQEVSKTLVKIVDKETKELIEGVKIEIHNEKGKVEANIEQGEEKGTYKIKQLPIGHYKIVQTEIPYEKGYVEKQEVEIEVKDTNEFQETVIEQEISKASIKIVDEETKELLEDVEIEIHDENGKVEADIEKITNTKEEKEEIEANYTIKRLPVGKYKIVETKIPYEKGYVIKQEKEIEVKDTSKWQEEIIEQEISKILIKVIDEETKELLEGVEIEINDENGKVETNIERKKGAYYIKRLPVGKYKIVETKIPYEKGYVEKQKIDIEVKDTNTWQETLIKQAISKTLIKVIDEETKELITGVKIQVIQKDTNKVVASTEDKIQSIEETKDGYIIKRLPVGEYIIKEEVPVGYKQIEVQDLIIQDKKEETKKIIDNRKLIFNMNISKALEAIRINGKLIASPKPEDLAKIELKSKELKNYNVELDYVIEVKNIGELEGTVGKIIDKIPNGLEYVEKEKGMWELNGSVAECNKYKDKKLAIGESLKVRITLKWKNSEFNFGEKKNIATLEGSTNEFGYINQSATDSKNNEPESTASVLISLHTGLNEKISIIIVLITLILIGIAIIMKKRK